MMVQEINRQIMEIFLGILPYFSLVLFDHEIGKMQKFNIFEGVVKNSNISM